MTDETKELISEEVFNAYPQGFRDWVAELEWKREEITGIELVNETLRDFEAERNSFDQWRRWKQGKHIDVAIERGAQNHQSARFIRSDDGGWQKKAGSHVSTFGVFERAK